MGTCLISPFALKNEAVGVVLTEGETNLDISYFEHPACSDVLSKCCRYFCKRPEADGKGRGALTLVSQSSPTTRKMLEFSGEFGRFPVLILSPRLCVLGCLVSWYL